MSEITITFETIYEILRREKNREDLQQVNPTFYNDVSAYIQEKKAILNRDDDSEFFIEERKNTERQLVSIRKMIKELYDRRRRKIIDMSLSKSRSSIILIDESSLLDEERMLFDSLLSLFKSHQKITESLFDGTRVIAAKAAPSIAAPSIVNEEKSAKFVRFLSAMPKFLAEDGQEYGPFNAEDAAEIPLKAAAILITKEKAVEAAEIVQTA